MIEVFPRENTVFFGNTSAEQILSKDLNNNSFKKAYLISGNYGIGKETLAFRFTRNFLAYLKPKSLNMDSSHPTFKQVSKGVFPNLLETPHDKITIEDIRHMLAKIQLKVNGRRVVIVHNADSMNKFVANSLLKVIEEPPSDTIFILLSKTPNIMPTIKSRCSHIHLSALERDDMAKALEYYQINENITEISYGSIGLAQQLDTMGGLDFYQRLLEALENRTLLQNNEFMNNFNIVQILLLKLFPKSALFHNYSYDNLLKCEIDFFQKKKKFSTEIYADFINYFSNIERLLLDKETIFFWLQETLRD